MIAENLHDFLIASVGASASFIGLLFVALTLVLGRKPTGSALVGRERALASSSYTALVTIFFISMVGLLPGADLGWVLVAAGWLGVLSSLRLSRAEKTDKRQKERVSVVSTLTVIYLALVIFGLYTANHTGHTIDANVLFAILFILYTTALNRAWALIGVELSLPDQPDDRSPRKRP